MITFLHQNYLKSPHQLIFILFIQFFYLIPTHHQARGAYHFNLVPIHQLQIRATSCSNLYLFYSITLIITIIPMPASTTSTRAILNFILIPATKAFDIMHPIFYSFLVKFENELVEGQAMINFFLKPSKVRASFYHLFIC